MVAIIRRDCSVTAHVISRNADTDWPLRSPDLTVRDFFFFKALKEIVVYSTRSRAIRLTSMVGSP